MAPSKPPRLRKSGVGEPPKVRRSEAAEKPTPHRCRQCRRMRIEVLEQRGPGSSTHYVCQSCLEELGQMRLDDAQ